MRSLSILLFFCVTAASVLVQPSMAGPIAFDGRWSEQRLQLFNSNDYAFNGRSLQITSDGAVSLAWVPTQTSDWGATSASWNWAVDQSVPATDLRRKGGDDRNVSLYFVFLPEAEAARMQGANIRQLQRTPSVRILQYVWGGTHAPGAIFGSPYAPGQGANVMLRQAGTGRATERVNLAQDFATAFGGAPGALVGIAVSADSDDTGTAIRATLSDLRVD
ncbi:DUF3047 domain-containing protein [Thalassorhabdomicrobium marinisediminis]|uniref:DUF3047 domain-containing protein n=1 Tax=Thalassorhabdomicrobium marinisediminis TaxID=2170577 RepID=UPI002490B5D5|nr:DUF3047 domain-containing protein [Thalassorhabdomicrobium marinisediminis]